MERLQKGYSIPVLDHGHVIYVDHMGSDREICAAARVSYRKSEEEKSIEDDLRLLDYLYRNKHTSPFEMCKVVFNIKMPIFVCRQYVRHRMQNMNEVSARYTELPDEFYIPSAWRRQAVKNKQGSDATGESFVLPKPYSITVDRPGPGDPYTVSTVDPSRVLREHCRASYELYKDMIQAGIAREMARMVLPINIYTEVRACWDLKNLLHFIALREDAHAQAEIQRYAEAMKYILKELFPLTMSVYETHKPKI